MDSPYIGAIILWGGVRFVPQGWLACEGQTLTIQQYTALYSLLGTTYGGDGTTTFKLPDLRGVVPVGMGSNTSRSNTIISTVMGQGGGNISNTLIQAQLPPHTHTWAAQQSNLQTTATNVSCSISATSSMANTDTPSSSAYLAKAALDGSPANIYNNTVTTSDTKLPNGSVNIPSVSVTGSITGVNATTGSGQAFSITPPYLALKYIIAVEGLYPPQP